ncbi:MAG: DNA-binding protein WhiA [Eubacteriales bacterium]
MSFSKEVKEELRKNISRSSHCRLVEQATAILYGEYGAHHQMEDIFQSMVVEKSLLERTCCKRTFLKMAYLAIGSMSDPEKGYHLEYVCVEEQQALQIQEIIACFEIETRIIERKKHYVVYMKEGSSIVELLNVMGAHVSLMNFENLRIVKEMRNSVNRRVNCETANISKTVTAATKQITDIEYLITHHELEDMPLNLQEMAQVRLEYPDASLQELGSYLQPTVGKSGVNHRLRKISERARFIRGED